MVKKRNLLNKSYSGLQMDRRNGDDPFVDESNPKQQEVKDPVIKKIHVNLGFKIVYLLYAIAIVSTISWIVYKQVTKEEYIPVTYLSSDNWHDRYTKHQRNITLREPLISQTSRQADMPEIAADTYLAFNPDTYQVYLSEGVTDTQSIASLTKIMSALIIIDHYDMSTQQEVSKQIDPKLEWKLNLQVGDRISTIDALYAMLLSSYNDPAVLLADNYPGGYDAFIAEMNRRAQLWGMYDTHFTNPHGYDNPDHFSTATDLRKLILQAIKNDELLNIVDGKGDTIKIYRNNGTVESKNIYTTNNLLITDTATMGLKTGTTKDAGACFIGYFDEQDNGRIITILLDSKQDRFDETSKMLEYIRLGY